MTGKTQSRPRLQRLSIRASLPGSAMLVAALLSLAFLGATIAGHVLDANSRSADQAEALAELLAPDAAAEDAARLSDALEVLAPEGVGLLAPDGGLMAGQVVERPRHRLALRQDGTIVGYLVAERLVQPQLVIPGWAVATLLASTLGLAALSSRFYAERISSGLEEITSFVERWHAGTAVDMDAIAPDNFAEIARLRQEVLRTFTRQTRLAEELQAKAYRSRLTNLPNETALVQALDTHLASADFDQPVCFILLDLDHFDRACETLGGDISQPLLRASIRRIKSELTKLGREGTINAASATLAHLGADDFGLILPSVSGREEVSNVARMLRRAFVAPVDLEGRQVRVGLSGGIVMAPEDGTRSDDLLRRSTIALRSIRQEKQGGFKFFTPQLDRVAKGRLQLEAEMREGIEKGEFTPFFQPKVDFRTGRIAGCEALARWTRAEGRTVSPTAFIPVAEETGLIREIGRQVLDQSCIAAAGWLKDGWGIPVAVNVSPAQLMGEEFRDQVLAALTSAGLPPRYLELEITESMAIEDPRKFQEVIGPLKAMGVRLAIDDFGTGHSNLAILSRLSFDVFKIDRQFILSLQRDDSARPIVEMILAMAESLGLETVAEGVETPEQARFLRRRGCTYAQGFLYSPALQEAEFRSFVESWERRRQKRVTRAAQ